MGTREGWVRFDMRRLYQRRADTMVFVTIAAISVGVLAAYFQMQEQAGEPASASAPPESAERLVLMPTSAPASVDLDPAVVEARMPHLAAAFREVQETGSAAIADPAIIDTIWFQLSDTYDVTPRLPLVVSYEGVQYRLQMID